MAGFFGKYLVFTAAIESDMVWVAVLGALTTVLQSVFLIILFTQMFAKTPTKSPSERTNQTFDSNFHFGSIESNIRNVSTINFKSNQSGGNTILPNARLCSALTLVFSSLSEIEKEKPNESLFLI